MLVLGRDSGQRVVVTHKPSGAKLVVSLEFVKSMKSARIGFDATKDFEVVREELLENDNAQRTQ